MNKYSIILPVKNGGSYVKECVNSILSQSYTDFDLLILENKSTDGTTQWLSTINDNRVIIYPADQPLSITENWSRILTLKKNEFFTIIGHDDILLPHYLEEMNRLIQKHPEASLYQAHFSFIDENGKFIRSCLPMDEVQQAHELLASLTAKTLDSMGTGYMFRSKYYDEMGGISPLYPDLLFADNELWVKLTAISYKATSFENCFSYRLHQSLSRTTAGMSYYKSFSQYILFQKNVVKDDKRMKAVMDRFGEKMLTEYCEAVAHRLLKTPMENRNISVKEFVEECSQHAKELLSQQNFIPTKNTRLAVTIDNNKIARRLFQAFRKRYKGKL